MRLQSIAHGALRSHEVVPKAREILEQINWSGADPLSALESTEQLVADQCRTPQADDAGDFAADGDRQIARLLITQCVAGRLGRWAVREGELDDAKLARGLLKNVGPMQATDAATLVIAAEELFRMGQYVEAASYLLNADRARRSTSCLFKLAVCLWKAARYDGALWSIRACLLEDLGAFDRPESLLKAQMVESSLRAIVEKRGSFDALQAAIGRLPEGSREGIISTIDRLEGDAFDIDVDDEAVTPPPDRIVDGAS